MLPTFSAMAGIRFKVVLSSASDGGLPSEESEGGALGVRRKARVLSKIFPE